MTIGRTDDPENPFRATAFKAASLFGTGSRTPSGPAVMAPRQQAEHMIAVDPPVRLLISSLASKGPSTHGTEGSGHTLRLAGFKRSRGMREYSARAADCGACALKAQCTTPSARPARRAGSTSASTSRPARLPRRSPAPRLTCNRSGGARRSRSCSPISSNSSGCGAWGCAGCREQPMSSTLQLRCRT